MPPRAELPEITAPMVERRTYCLARTTEGPQTSTAFTIVELLVVVGIVALLATLLMPAVNGAIDKGRTTKSLAQIGQIYGAISQYVVDNEGQFPYAYGSSGSLPSGATDRDFWYNVVKVRLYPHPTAANRSALDGPTGWGPPSATDTTGTVLRSPNAEKSWPKSVISYGYNNRFVYRPGASQKLALVHNNSQTALLADNLGNTHSLTPDNSTSAGKLNARNGATRDLGTNGVAIATFIDGHAEFLSASECASRNADKSHPFWGPEP